MRMRLFSSATTLSLFLVAVAASCGGSREDVNPNAGAGVATPTPTPTPVTDDEPGDGIDGDGDGSEDRALAEDESLTNAEASAAAAAAAAAAADDDVDAPNEAATELEDDLALPPPDVANLEPQLADGTPQVVYVNFGGPIVRNCSTFCNNALTNHSTLIGSNFKRSSVDFLPYTNVTGRKLIVSRLRTYYAPYWVNVTTSRPSHGPYTMVVISPSAVGPTAKRGVSYLDCGNRSTRSDIAFVFRIKGVSAGMIAHYAAHELGHTLGLMHVKSSYDIMQYASSGHLFTSSTLDVARNPPGYTCFPGRSVQNAPATLKLNVGARP